MSVGLAKPKMSPPGTSGVPFGGSTLAQRSETLAGRTGALRGKSAAMTGVIKHAINKAGERPVLTRNAHCVVYAVIARKSIRSWNWTVSEDCDRRLFVIQMKRRPQLASVPIGNQIMTLVMDGSTMP